MHHATGCCQHCWLPETPTPPAIGSGVVALPAPYPTSKRLARRLRTRGHGIPLDHPPAALGACCTTRHPLCGRCGTTGRSPPEAATLAAATEVVQSFHEPFSWNRLFAGEAVSTSRRWCTGPRSLPVRTSHSPPAVTWVHPHYRHRAAVSLPGISNPRPEPPCITNKQGPCQARQAGTANRIRSINLAHATYIFVSAVALVPTYA